MAQQFVDDFVDENMLDVRFKGFLDRDFLGAADGVRYGIGACRFTMGDKNWFGAVWIPWCHFDGDHGNTMFTAKIVIPHHVAETLLNANAGVGGVMHGTGSAAVQVALSRPVVFPGKLDFAVLNVEFATSINTATFFNMSSTIPAGNTPTPVAVGDAYLCGPVGLTPNPRAPNLPPPTARQIAGIELETDVAVGDSGRLVIANGTVFSLLGHSVGNARLAVCVNVSVMLSLLAHVHLSMAKALFSNWMFDDNREAWSQVSFRLLALHSIADSLHITYPNYVPCNLLYLRSLTRTAARHLANIMVLNTTGVKVLIGIVGRSLFATDADGVPHTIYTVDDAAQATIIEDIAKTLVIYAAQHARAVPPTAEAALAAVSAAVEAHPLAAATPRATPEDMV